MNYPLEKNLIKDHNVDGFDSVDSEDFDPGYGCVPIEKPKVNYPPCYPPPKWTENDQRNYEMSIMTEQEKDQRNFDYLQKHGI